MDKMDMVYGMDTVDGMDEGDARDQNFGKGAIRLCYVHSVMFIDKLLIIWR